MIVKSADSLKWKSPHKKMNYHLIAVFLSILLIFTVITPLTINAQEIKTWSSTITFNEPGGASDTVILSEAPDALDGPPRDQYDIPKPIPPMSPYIRAWFDDGLTQPYHLLWEDCRQYPAISKTWNLIIQWAPEDFVSSTSITINWNPSILIGTEYNSIDLYHSGSFAVDMRTQGSYSYTAPAFTPTPFTIICNTIGNQPPFAINDLESTQENTPIEINVSDNDYDLDGALDLDSIDITIPPSHGTTLIQPNTGIVTYTPPTDYSGQDFFYYTIDDNQGTTSNQALVNITIIHLNQPPNTTNDFFNVNENSTNNILTILDNDYDVDGDQIQINTITNPLHGTATHNGQTITYTPTVGYAGSDTFEYSIIDDNGSEPVTGDIEIIIQTNNPPTTPSLPNGPTSGYISTSYTFSTTATDPEHQDISYGWDINNDSITDQWTGPEHSGDTSTIINSWDTIGTYTLKVKAQDTLGKESPWSNTHTIVIKKKTSSGGGGSPGPTPNIQPNPHASATTTYQTQVNNDIFLNGSKSTDTDGYITTWNWELGDGIITTGETITHQYTKEGQYTVILTVIDNNDGTNSDQITIEITKPNQPPQNLRITGPTLLKKHQQYSFTITAHDPENNLIQYIIDWGDTTNTTLPYQASDTSQTLNHTWQTTGPYTITIIAQDNTATETSTSTPLVHTVFVDIWEITGAIQGYLIDTNSDDIYDQFHNTDLQIDTKIALQPNGTYLIDADGNNTWDYLYNINTNTLHAYIVTTQIEAFPLIIISFFAFILLFLTIFIIKSVKRKKIMTHKKKKNSHNKKPPKK